jgi:DNA repair exonuclease SbcCD ATPase subunit
MHFQKLKLHNFRSHAETELELDRINVIRAPNGHGKTSIQLAIEYALTGMCDRTDQAGRGADSMIRLGSSELSIELLSTDLNLNRRRSRSGGSLVASVRGKTLTGRQAQDYVGYAIAPIPVISAVLNSGRFIDMSPEEQADLLTKALATEPVPVDPAIVELVKAAGYTPVVKISSAAEIESQHKTFYDARTAANRVMREMGQLQEPVAAEDLPDLEDVNTQLRDLGKQRDGLLQGKLSEHHSFQRATETYEAAENQQRQAESRLLTDADIKVHNRNVRDKAKVAQLDLEIGRYQAEVHRIRALIAQLQAQPNECPTCRQPIDNSTTAKELEVARPLLTDAENGLKKSQEKRQAYGNPEHSQGLLDEHREAGAQLLRAQTIISKGRPKEPDLQKIQADIEKLDARILEWQRKRDEINKYEAAAAEYQRQAKIRHNQEQRVKDLERLIEYFGPQSPIRAALVGGRLEGFRNRINQSLNRFGFACEFELEPYRIGVFTDPAKAATPGPGLSLNQLSESEQFRFAIAFQIALAEATRVGLVVIDRADMLSPDARFTLSELLYNSELYQAFVLTTGDVSTPASAAGLPPGVQIVDLEKQGDRTQVKHASRHKESAPAYVAANQ